MRKLVLFVVLALVAAPVAAWLADNPGQVRIAWLDVEIETTVGLLLVGVLLVAAAAVLAFELLRWLFGLPRRLRERRGYRRLAEGYEALTTGLVAAAAGDVASARHHVRRAEKLLEDGVPALLLLEAQTAQLQGDETDAIRRFRAMLRNPETELLGLRGLLAHALKDGDQATALELARKAHRRSPSTP
ncbi:MAG TPA: heme biosynthesis protein HemY, partial [Rhodospirillales bacterium]|nr:heme biosynthesis protein HemY [Rhodospirillales bacterium]